MTEEPRKKPRKKPDSANARALAECRRRGWEAEVVEKRIPRCFITRDLFGCIDIVAITDRTLVAIQVTGGGHHTDRRSKVLAEPRLLRWLLAGGQFLVWSYDKRGGRGERKVYTLREEEILLTDALQARESAAHDGADDQLSPVQEGAPDQLGL